MILTSSMTASGLGRGAISLSVFAQVRGRSSISPTYALLKDSFKDATSKGFASLEGRAITLSVMSAQQRRENSSQTHRICARMADSCESKLREISLFTRS